MKEISYESKDDNMIEPIENIKLTVDSIHQYATSTLIALILSFKLPSISKKNFRVTKSDRLNF